MSSFSIKSGVEFSQTDMHVAMLDAFSDYEIPMRPSPHQFAQMMQQRGLDCLSSRIATINGQIAGLWLTAVRANRAYLILSGTSPAHRAI